MKNRDRRGRDDYRLLKSKLLVRTFGMMLLAFVLIEFLYSLFLRGHIADAVVGILEIFVFHNYNSALDFYADHVRGYMEFFFIGGAMLVFGVLLRFYLNEFSKYFREIDRGIDILLKEEGGEVTLSPELAAVEKKINSVKHTLIRQNSEIQLAEQRKNDLIMYLAHDLKTPLASVIGYLNLLRDEGQIAEELRERYLSISLEKAQRLEDLINEFFEIARFNLSHITLQYSRINITRLLEQLVYEFKPMLKDKNLSCNLDAADGIALRCDADKIQRVLDNLLRNAVLYSYENTAIDISVTEPPGNLVIKFVNCGDTISVEKLDRIFEQFYRLDTARSTNGGGAGLGLAIAKQIVELHGGTITAKSEREKTEFTVSLPVS